MFRQRLDMRYLLTFLAIAIVTGTLFYTRYLTKKIQQDERLKISQWVEANKFIANAPENIDLTLAVRIQQENDDIPVILTNEQDSIIDYRNLPETKATSGIFLEKKLREFKKANPPIDLILNEDPLIVDHYYYGESRLLKQIRYFPIIQLLIVALFIYITVSALTIKNKSEQNQVWAGLARETAHQLGTPLTSLQGWIEILKSGNNTSEIPVEMQKDVDRLELISDRFGKIGSAPQLEENDIVSRIQRTVNYIKRVAPGKVSINIVYDNSPVLIKISGPLFDWVIENLLKNALDAMGHEGRIDIRIFENNGDVIVEVQDTGKGISISNLNKIFNPGFTTKKRGWGLGLSLCKRIIEQYHKGHLSVKETELNKGTTFRIVLGKSRQ